MSVADELNKTRQYLKEAYAKVEEKGGTLPEQQNMANLADAIGTVSGGITPRPPLPEYPYPVEEFDGGEYGAIAYLRDDTVHYYTATSDRPMTLTHNSSSPSTVVTLEDGFKVTTDIVLAYAVGSETTSVGTSCCAYFPLLQNFYFSKNSKLTSIGSGFLSNCPNFNYPIDVPEGVREITNNFLARNTAFNQPVTLPESITAIADGFLDSCKVFNQPLVIPSRVTKIGTTFLQSCSEFNSVINFPDGLSSIGTYFMYQCTSFNQPLVIPDTVTSIGTIFMSTCRSFNQPFSFPAGTASIPANVLTYCYGLNSPVTFRGNPTSIGGQFMRGCTAYAQPLTIPDSITSIGDYFLFDNESFTGPLNVGKASGVYSSNYMLSTSTASAPMYTEGVTLTGENAQAWKDQLPDRTSPYRKLIVAS